MPRPKTLESPTIQVVCKFLKSICSVDHPIVLIIDDIQWIDSSSLELVESLAAQKNLAGFMLVATGRDDEITSDHPVSQMIQKLKHDQDISITDIHVGILSIETVAELVVDRFPTLAGRDLGSLSTILHTHTKGNAFFTVQLLHRLKNSGWVAPANRDHDSQSLDEWDSSDERSMINHLTELNCEALVDIVMSDTADESPCMKEVLTSASCLGSDFMTSHLMLVVKNQSTDHIHESLAMMEQREFIRPRLGGKGWSWAHDKFQKAAYLLIDANKRQKFHLTVGRRLLSSLDKEDLQQHLFIVVSQFCIALKSIEKDEAESIATLLLQAGEKSAQSSSFGKAAAYFSMGTSLLKADNWESQYELSLRLYNSLAAIEGSRGNFIEADKLVNVILRHSRSVKDRLRAYEVKLRYLAGKDENDQAVLLGLDVLEQLGEKFPRNPGVPKIVYEVLSTRWLLAKKSVDGILNLKPLTDWKKLAVLQIIQCIFPALFRGKPQLIPIFACRSIKLMLKHGLSDLSSYSFSVMSAIFNHPLGCLDEGYKCMKVCEGIVEKYDVKDFVKARNSFTLIAVCRPFRSPIQHMVKPLEETASLGLMTGDVDIACMCFVSQSYTMFFSGERLDIIVPVAREYARKFRSWGRSERVLTLTPLGQLMENLTCPSHDPCTFTGEVMYEEEWIDKANMANDDFRNICFWVLKTFMAVYLGEHEKAKEFRDKLMKINPASCNGALVFQRFFLDALVDILLARDKNNGGGKAKRYKPSLKKLRFYGKDAPSNAKNKINLIEAELEVLKHGKCDSAIVKFHQSIEDAKVQGLTFEEAYGYERYGIAMLEWGDVTHALEYFERAKYLYEQWGSPVKVLQLIKFVQVKSGVTMKGMIDDNVFNHNTISKEAAVAVREAAAR